MNESMHTDSSDTGTSDREMALVRIFGLNKDSFAVVDNQGSVLIAGINEEDMRPGARMRLLQIEDDTLYYGQLQDLCHRIQGAIQDTLEAKDYTSSIRALPVSLLDPDHIETGDAYLDAMMKDLPAFRDVLLQCFGDTRGPVRRRRLP